MYRKSKILNLIGGIVVICAIILPAKLALAACCPSGCTVQKNCPSGCVGVCGSIVVPGGIVDCADPDRDFDGFPSIECGGPDCDDLNSLINPSIPESCDNVDNNCNGQVDESLSQACSSACGSGTKTCSAGSWSACSAPEPKTETCNNKDDDCNGKIDDMGYCFAGVGECKVRGDLTCVFGGRGSTSTTCSAIAGTPKAETCDGKDNDCDGLIDEGLTAPNASKTLGVCSGAKKTCSGSGGWKDPDFGSDYQAVETWCDGKDNDCNGQTDESFTTKGQSCDGTDTDLCKEGTYNCSTDKLSVTCSDTTGNATEICNGLDDDCNGSIPTNESDADGDGVRVCAGDCNDNDAAIKPGAAELCDGKDNNCNGQIDELFATKGQSCDGADTDLCKEGTYQCSTDKLSVTCSDTTGSTVEVCDGVDNDCNGSIDENIAKIVVDVCNEKQCLNGSMQPVYTTAACNDGNSCTTNDTCSNGSCIGVASGGGVLAGGFICLGDGTPPIPGNCVNDSQCSDGNSCTTEACVNHFCQQPVPLLGTGKVCNNGGIGACYREGVNVCSNGVLSCNAPTVSGVAETCDGVDNDCDGSTDEGLGNLTCGISECANSVSACLNGVSQTCTQKPAGVESCDGKDNDCDGSTDEGLGTTTCGKGACTKTVDYCKNGTVQACTPLPSGIEICDNIDNDCDGSVDESPSDLDDSDACTTDACVNGAVTHTAVDINDNDKCTTDTCDIVQGVQHAAITCNDNNACTNNTCSPTVGCQYPDIPPPQMTLLPCEEMVCSPTSGWAKQLKSGFCLINGACVDAGSSNGNNKCQVCDVKSPNGWTNSPVTQSCVDSDLCTENDHCDGGGKCVSGTQKYVEASTDLCLKNECDPSTGNTVAKPTNENGQCSDGDLCTQTDKCQAGKCVGSNPVTCNENDQCQGAGSCDKATGLCSYPPLSDTPCNADSDGCTSGDKCIAGACQKGSLVDCSAQNDQCNVGACQSNGAAKYSCIKQAKPDGFEIPDGDKCNGTEICLGGVPQAGTPLDCDDKKSCTKDSCNKDTGCINECIGNGLPNPLAVNPGEKYCYNCAPTGCGKDSECGNGNPCDGAEICMAGTCLQGAAPQIDDNNKCTIDSCDPALGVVNTVVDPDDHNKCTTDSCDPAIGIINAPIVVEDDKNLCTTDSCDPVVGVQHKNNTGPCDDGDICTENDICGGGKCNPGNGVDKDKDGQTLCGGNDCNDNDSQMFVGNPEVCDGKDNNCSGVADDGLGTTTCGVGACQTTINNCQNGSLKTCTPLPAGVETCDGIDNDCDGSIDEGLGNIDCGVGECKTSVSACVGGIPQTCTPKTPAPSESCDGKDNDCDGVADEDLGTKTCGVGICAKTVESCVNGTPQLCTPDAPGVELCDGKDNNCDGTVDDKPKDIDDNNICTTDACVGGAAVHTAISYDDGNACTADACDPIKGVSHTAIPIVDDGNLCTDDSCDPVKGMLHTNNTLPCGDGNSCNGLEVCGGGVCQSGTPINCDDLNDCTDESCNTVTGKCEYTNKGTGLMKTCTNFSACGTFTTCDACETKVDACNGIDDDCNGTVDDGYRIGEDCTKEIYGCQVKGVMACDISGYESSCNATATDSDADGVGDVCDKCPNNPKLSNGYNACGGCADLTIDTSCGDCGAYKCDGKEAQKCVGDVAKPCSDNDACTSGDHCGETGLCVSGAPQVIDDGDSCTIDSCDKASGVRHEAIKCEQKSNQCKEEVGSCNKATGQCEFANNTNPCEDGNLCTENDRCASGTCTAGAPKICSDNLACTTDTCDPAKGECKFDVTIGCLINGVCYDKDFVNTAESCQICNPVSNNKGWSAKSEGLACTDDSDKCTSDICVVGLCKHQPLGDGKKECYSGPVGTKDVGECKHGTSTCTSGDWQACVGEVLPATVELCDDKDNDCDGLVDEDFINKGAECSAGNNACGKAGKYVCSSDKSTTVCDAVAGSPLPEACNGKDDDCDGSVDEDLPKITCGVGVCMNSVEACAGGVPQVCTPLACDDENLCTTNDKCDVVGKCGGDAIKCDDGNSCTTDGCDVATGCVYNPIPECKIEEPPKEPPAVGKNASRIFDLTKTRAVYLPFKVVTNVTVVGEGLKQLVLVEGLENGISKVATLQMSKLNPEQGTSQKKATAGEVGLGKALGSETKPEFNLEAKKEGIKIAGFNSAGDRFAFSDKCVYEIAGYVDQVASGQAVNETETCLPEDQVCAGYKISSIKLGDVGEEGVFSLMAKINCPSESGDIEKVVNLTSQSEKKEGFVLNVAGGEAVDDDEEVPQTGNYLSIEDKKFDKEIVKEEVKTAFGDEFVNNTIEKTTISGGYESIDKTNLLVGGLYSIRVGFLDSSADEYKAMSGLKLTPYDADVENNICSSVIDGVQSGPDAAFIMPKFLNKVAMKTYSKPDLLVIAELVAKEDINNAIEGKPYEPQAVAAFFFFNANEAPTVKITSQDKDLVEKSVQVLPNGGIQLVADGFDQTNDDLEYKWSCEDSQGADCSNLLSSKEGKEITINSTPADSSKVEGLDVSVNAAPSEKSFGIVVVNYPITVTVKAIDPGELSGEESITIVSSGVGGLSQSGKASDIIGGGEEEVVGQKLWWTSIGGGGCQITATAGPITLGDVFIGLLFLMGIPVIIIRRSKTNFS